MNRRVRLTVGLGRGYGMIGRSRDANHKSYDVVDRIERCVRLQRRFECPIRSDVGRAEPLKRLLWPSVPHISQGKVILKCNSYDLI